MRIFNKIGYDQKQSNIENAKNVFVIRSDQSLSD